MNSAKCIAFKRPIDLGNHPNKSVFVVCQNCGARLEIIRVDPPFLDWPLIVSGVERNDSNTSSNIYNQKEIH